MNNKEDLPIVMNVDHVRKVLGCGRRQAYELMDRKDFPTIRFNRSKLVKREDFFDWLDKQKQSV